MSALLGKPVAVGEIAGELKKLWEADDAATNASLMNLAIYSEASGALERNSKAIMELTREHACRAILVEMEREAEETSAEAWVTAQCHLAHGRKSVCCEQLAFRLRGKAVGRMRNTVFANLSSDLPLVFWWQGDLSELFEERLYRLLDRFIVDSSEGKDVLANFIRIRRAVEDSRCRMVVQDLSWTRTFHVRLGIAGLFDDPVAQDMLEKVEEVKLGGAPEHWTSLWMMLAWMATQAEWRFLEKTGDGFAFERKNGGRVEVLVKLEEGAAPVSLVEMSGGDVRVQVKRKAGDCHLELGLDGPGHEVRQVAPADPDDSVDLVAEQLSRGGKNSLFRKTWPVFFELLKA